MITEHLNKVLKKGKLTGANRKCEYYPCHDLENMGFATARDISSYDSEMDCTFCFCPFYPCNDTSTGGEMTATKSGEVVWGCKECTWIHEPGAAQKILNELLKLNVKNIEEIDCKKLAVIRLKCLK